MEGRVFDDDWSSTMEVGSAPGPLASSFCLTLKDLSIIELFESDISNTLQVTNVSPHAVKMF
jgi:hypothetical protein